MNKQRLEAFSDGVIAILITIMVLDLHSPAGASLRDLASVLPSLLCYLMSFIYLGIYWNNHHHMLQVTRHVDGAVLWANLHLLFWLSLVPFMTRWIAEHYRSAVPTAVYGVVLLCAALAYTILQRSIIRVEGPESTLARAVQGDAKGLVSLATYATAIGMAFVAPAVADACFVAVAIIWLVPDRRIERIVGHVSGHE